MVRKLVVGIVMLIFCGIIFLNLDSIHSVSKSDTDIATKEDNFEFLPLSPEDKRAKDQGITLSREYQMKLHKEAYANREKGMEEVLPILSNILGIPEIASPTYGNATVRFQYIHGTKSCGKSFNPRIRNYYTGYRAGTSTLDIKSSTDGHTGPEKIAQQSWLPRDEYLDGHIQKYEWDIHPCKIKYSLEGRIFVPFEHQFKTCSDIAQLFYRIGDNIPSEKMDKELTINELYSGWWYEFEQRGLLWDGVTEYKTAITLEYNSKGEAISGKGPIINSAEWSIRIFATNHGTGRWVRDTVEKINERYFKLLDYFGTPDFPCTGEYEMDALEIK